jgi:hypothetical protein
LSLRDGEAVTVCIANLNGHEAVQLAVESVLGRTRHPDFRILVYNSPGDGQDRPYLQGWANVGWIDLIAGMENLSHGHAIARMLGRCETPLACLLDSDCEILRSDWLSYLTGLLETENDIGAAKFRPGGKFYGKELLTPYYWLACALLVMPLYRLVEAPDDWPTKRMPYERYSGPFKFDGIPEGEGWHVGYDTGGGFAERILYENERGFIMRKIPASFWDKYVRHYGGISRNHWRPEHPQIAPRWRTIKKRLAMLRAEA